MVPAHGCPAGEALTKPAGKPLLACSTKFFCRTPLNDSSTSRVKRSAVDEPKNRIETGWSACKLMGEVVACDAAAKASETMITNAARAHRAATAHLVVTDNARLVRTIAGSLLV